MRNKELEQLTIPDLLYEVFVRLNEGEGVAKPAYNRARMGVIRGYIRQYHKEENIRFEAVLNPAKYAARLARMQQAEQPKVIVNDPKKQRRQAKQPEQAQQSDAQTDDAGEVNLMTTTEETEPAISSTIEVLPNEKKGTRKKKVAPKTCCGGKN